MIDTKERLRHLVAETMQMLPEEITDARPFEELGMDSFDRVDLTMAVEEEFGFDFPPDAMLGEDEYRADCLNDLVKIVEKELA